MITSEIVLPFESHQQRRKMVVDSKGFATQVISPLSIFCPQAAWVKQQIFTSQNSGGWEVQGQGLADVVVEESFLIDSLVTW